MRLERWLCVLVALALAGAAPACGGGDGGRDGGPDTGRVDMGTAETAPPDEGAPDTGPPPDMGTPPDEGTPDTGPPPDADMPDGPVEPDVEMPDVTCPAGQRRCGAVCATATDPMFGCGAMDCAPCALANATPTCGAAGCAVGTCNAGFANCDMMAANGCEVALESDNANCGMCGRACGMNEACMMGVCRSTLMCTSPEILCEGRCVNAQTDPTHCGRCGNACTGGTMCVAGACVCPAGQMNCAGTCINTATDNANCGMCGRVCTGGTMCAAGMCACPPGQMNCSGRCLNTQTDNANCGACGRTCTGGTACSGGMCVCPPGQMNCSGTCRATQFDPMNCGACGRACMPGQACTAGVCTGCAVGQTNCGGTCANTQTDTANCGACGRACAPGQNCMAGVCTTACLAGETSCSGVCRDLQNDPEACGACGTRCTATQICRGGTCTGGGVVGRTFQIATLGSTGCTTVEHDAQTGDDHGGIALSPNFVFVTGDTATAGATAGTLSNLARTATRHVAIASNLRDGTVYYFANGAAELSSAGGNATTLRTLDDRTGAPTGGVIVLSTPIAMGGNTGIFSGYDRIVVHNSMRVYDIELPSGRVTDLGAAPVPAHTACESFAYWGVAEYFSGRVHLAYVNGNTIQRYAVGTGAVTTIATFTNLADMCSFTVSPSRNRWYFHHEFTSQFRAGGSETLGFCPATFNFPGTNFSASFLYQATDCNTTVHDAQSGDDHGGIAVSSANVFYTGDTATVRASAADLSGLASIGARREALTTNLLDATVWQFSSSGTELNAATGGLATRISEVNGATGALTGRFVVLSTAIQMFPNTGIFAGYDRLLVLAPISMGSGTGRAYHIDIPTGLVTDLGTMPIPAHNACESFGWWGLVERTAAGGLAIVYVGSSTQIRRTTVPGNVTTTVATFSNLADMCSISGSVARRRWYFHHESASQFRPGATIGSEVLGYCRADWLTP